MQAQARTSRALSRLPALAAAFVLFLASPTHAGSIALAWGRNTDLQCQIPLGLTNVAALAAGDSHSLALRTDGQVVAWGLNSLGQASVPANLTGATAIAARNSYSMALLSNGTVRVWGKAPTLPADLQPLAAIAAGRNHCLGLKPDGTVVSWGSVSDVPANLASVVAIAAGNSNSLALRADGTVIAWGNNAYGKSTVPPGLGDVQAIAAGTDHCLALKQDGTVVAWGANTSGQLNIPAGLTNVAAIAAGSAHNVVLKLDGTLVAWGDNSYNQADINSSASNFIGVAAGGFHSLAMAGDGSPFILLHPRDVTVMTTKAATFRVSANGNSPLRYQWRHNNVNIPNATNASLTISNTLLADAGPYSVVVANNLGSVTSSNAMLFAIETPPFITVQPQDQSVLWGKDAAFSSAADGSAPISYQWEFEGNPIPGATSTELLLTNVSLLQAGLYRLIATNPFGSATSAPAVLTVIAEKPFITLQPQDQSVLCGESGGFSSAAGGTAPITYQWEFGGIPIPGATSTELLLTNVSRLQAGLYRMIATNPFGSATSAPAALTVISQAPDITSPLTAEAVQGQDFTYQITGSHSPESFGAVGMPPGLSINTTNGLISGQPLEDGVFGILLTAANSCASGSATLVLTIASSAPVITSSLTAGANELEDFTYQITASNAPEVFGAMNLPIGLIVDPATGLISGRSTYAGEFTSTIWASNVWGVGTADLKLTFTNAPIAGLSIANVTTNYSSPYLLDFTFSLRDNEDPSQGNAVVVAPRLLSVQCLEDEQAVSPSETAVIVASGSSKLMKASLVLDFSESIASLSNGDTNFDGISDAVDAMVASAQSFVNQQAADAQMAVYEFHREDMDPQKVLGMTSNKAALTSAIAGIWTNYVQWFPAGSRCWDALAKAISDMGKANVNEEHYVIFVSDGRDESSINAVTNVITAATNQNIKVYCVGFGNELDGGNLQNITTNTSGRLYTAANAAELASGFAQIGKDLSGQYILRWATLKRSTNSFMPSFKISYQGFTANSPTNPVTEDLNNPEIDTNAVPPTTNYPLVTNFIISPYTPSQHTGSVTVGILRVEPDAEVLPTGMTLRASYVPRFIRQIRLHYRPNWPCTASIQSTNEGEILYRWGLTETNDGAGGKWLLLSSPYPPSTTNSIPFAAFGRLVTFSFQDIVSPSNAFSLFQVDNTLYTNTGKQSFIVENTNQFLKVYPALPLGTPVPWLMANGYTTNFDQAELADPDGDGFLNWQEYRANTNPKDAASRLYVRTFFRGVDGRYTIGFPSAPNRFYDVESSTDLVTWDLVEAGIKGTGSDIAVTDTRYIPGVATLYYRVRVY